MNRKRLIKIAAWVLFGPLVVLFLFGWAMHLLLIWDTYSDEAEIREAAVEFAFDLRKDDYKLSLKKIADVPEAVRPFCDPSYKDGCNIVYDFKADPCKSVFPFFPQRCVTLKVSPTLLMDAEAFEKFRQAALYPCRFLPNRETVDAYTRPVRELWEGGHCDKGGDWVKRVYIEFNINDRTFRAAAPLERE